MTSSSSSFSNTRLCFGRSPRLSRELRIMCTRTRVEWEREWNFLLFSFRAQTFAILHVLFSFLTQTFPIRCFPSKCKRFAGVCEVCAVAVCPLEFAVECVSQTGDPFHSQPVPGAASGSWQTHRTRIVVLDIVPKVCLHALARMLCILLSAAISLGLPRRLPQA